MSLVEAERNSCSARETETRRAAMRPALPRHHPSRAQLRAAPLAAGLHRLHRPPARRGDGAVLARPALPRLRHQVVRAHPRLSRLPVPPRRQATAGEEVRRRASPAFGAVALGSCPLGRGRQDRRVLSPCQRLRASGLDADLPLRGARERASRRGRVESSGRKSPLRRLARQQKRRLAGLTQQGRQDSNLQPPVLETGALPD
jgi:hypothetical protein